MKLREKAWKVKGSAKKRISTVSEKGIAFQRKVKGKIATAILAAFGFIIALVWRDAIRDIVNKVVERLGITGTGYIYTIITALIITIVCILGIMFFSRWSEKK